MNSYLWLYDSQVIWYGRWYGPRTGHARIAAAISLAVAGLAYSCAFMNVTALLGVTAWPDIPDAAKVVPTLSVLIAAVHGVVLRNQWSKASQRVSVLPGLAYVLGTIPAFLGTIALMATVKPS